MPGKATTAMVWLARFWTYTNQVPVWYTATVPGSPTPPKTHVV